jgi:hypothetical protein
VAVIANVEVKIATEDGTKIISGSSTSRSSSGVVGWRYTE